MGASSSLRKSSCKPDLFAGAVPDTRDMWALWREKERHADALFGKMLDYVEREVIPLEGTFAFAGQVTVALAEITATGRTVFEPFAGEYFALIDALSPDGERVEDLVGWPVDEPQLFGAMLGRAAVLGGWSIKNPTSWQGGRRLRVWRTPLRWLQHGCDGVVLIDQQRGAEALAQALGPIVAEDERHAAQLYRILSTLPNPPTVGHLRSAA